MTDDPGTELPDAPPEDEGAPDVKSDPVTEPDDGDGEAAAGTEP